MRLCAEELWVKGLTHGDLDLANCHPLKGLKRTSEKDLGIPESKIKKYRLRRKLGREPSISSGGPPNRKKLAAQ